MVRLRVLSAIMFAISLVSCNGDSGQDTATDETPATPSSSMVSQLSAGTLGTVRYRYDPQELKRAEVEMVLPPDFEQTVFAIKFIPASLVRHIGDTECSFGRVDSDTQCSATSEVGFAMALLERPMADYTEAFARVDFPTARSEAVVVDGHEGTSFVYQTAQTRTRYTFVPKGSRTLLLVDRDGSGVHTGQDALAQVRDSIDL